MQPIEFLLRNRIGLDVASVGATTIERTLRLRMKSLGLQDLSSYLQHVTATPAEWEELLEAVVVTETWFFRDHAPFKAFAQMAEQELQSGRAEPLQILSVPCSTGEEPYSLAMALLDAGVQREKFHIHAVDVSARALERARRGLYGKNSFRGKALEFRQRHFKEAAGGFELNPEVRECVQLERGNLLDPNFALGRAAYDYIFCRNLLIYFDRATQRKALGKLHELLSPVGMLFVGPAEMPLASSNGFAPVGLPMAFACRKADANRGGRRGPDRTPYMKQAATSKPREQLPVAPAAGAVAEKASHAPSTVAPSLVQARILADAGQLREAAELCEAYVKGAGPCAEAYYLLGLILDAGGNSAAVDYYRKALYLQPDHFETLMQMALLLERNGDAAGAKTFRRRAERIQHGP